MKKTESLKKLLDSPELEFLMEALTVFQPELLKMRGLTVSRADARTVTRGLILPEGGKIVEV